MVDFSLEAGRFENLAILESMTIYINQLVASGKSEQALGLVSKVAEIRKRKLG